MNQLDELVDGLHDAGHKSRTKTLVPEYRAFEMRIERTTQDIAQLTSELSELNQDRATVLAPLNVALAALFSGPERRIVLTSGPLAIVFELFRATMVWSRQRVALRSYGRSIALGRSCQRMRMPSERTDVEAAGTCRRSRGRWLARLDWRPTRGSDRIPANHVFPDLPSWSSTDPASAAATASQRVTSEFIRIKGMLDRDEAAGKRENELNKSISKEEARGQLIDSQLAGVAKDAGDFAGALAALLPHVHTEDCPVCGRDFSQASPTEPLFGSLAKDHRAVDSGRRKTVGAVEGEVVIRWSAGAAASRAWLAETWQRRHGG